MNNNVREYPDDGVCRYLKKDLVNDDVWGHPDYEHYCTMKDARIFSSTCRHCADFKPKRDTT